MELASFPARMGGEKALSLFPHGLGTRLVRVEFTGTVDGSVYAHTQVVDARSTARFEGTAPEPHPSFPSGHIVGARNLPFYQMINPESKILKSKDEIREGKQVSHSCMHTFTLLCMYTSEFFRAGLDLDKAMVGSCGSGMTACILAFAAHMLGKDIPVYDVSKV